MRKQRKSRSQEEWQQIISEFEQSGLSRKDFCAQYDLGSRIFEKWYYRLRQNRLAKLVPINVASAQTLASQLCATLPQGIRLEFDSDLSPTYLKQVISAIQAC